MKRQTSIVLTLIVFSLILTGCGKKINQVQAPEGYEDVYPHRYPERLERPPVR